MSQQKKIKPIQKKLVPTKQANTSPSVRFSKLKDMMKNSKPPKIKTYKGC